jgi:DNA (cytosine-5)-methyltransferase 1
VNYLSFFSGALGLDLGLERAGFKPLMYCEFDKKCQETITLNQPNVPLLGDIRNYSAQDILQEIGLSQEDTIDLVVGTHAKHFQQLELDVHLKMNEVTYLFIIFK